MHKPGNRRIYSVTIIRKPLSQICYRCVCIPTIHRRISRHFVACSWTKKLWAQQNQNTSTSQTIYLRSLLSLCISSGVLNEVSAYIERATPPLSVLTQLIWNVRCCVGHWSQCQHKWEWRRLWAALFASVFACWPGRRGWLTHTHTYTHTHAQAAALLRTNVRTTCRVITHSEQSCHAEAAATYTKRTFRFYERWRPVQCADHRANRAGRMCADDDKLANCTCWIF